MGSDPIFESRPLLAVGLLALGLLVALFVYLIVAVPASWFPSSTRIEWSARDLAVVRGSSTLAGDAWVVTAPDAAGMTLVSLNAKIRATDYAAIAWDAKGIPDGADVRLLWRSDYQPEKVHSLPIPVEQRMSLPAIVVGNPAWMGNITGLALAIQGPLAQPLQIRGVEAKPLGAFELLRDRAREWLQFEAWTGTSINTIVGGADAQGLPLPLLLAVALLAAGAVAFALYRWWPGASPAMLASLLVTLFVSGWFLLDLRWTLNLSRQAAVTEAQYGNKNPRDKHLAAEDGQLYAAIEKARAAMPSTPVRVFVASDTRYLRERAAYHFFPNSAYTDRGGGVMPPASALRPGDRLFVYFARGIQYDPEQHMLRWGANETKPADLKLVVPGGALFEIR